MTQNNEFVTIALPKKVVNQIDSFIENSNHLYTSRPHVVKVALFSFFDKNGGGLVE